MIAKTENLVFKICSNINYEKQFKNKWFNKKFQTLCSHKAHWCAISLHLKNDWIKNDDHQSHFFFSKRSKHFHQIAEQNKIHQRFKITEICSLKKHEMEMLKFTMFLSHKLIVKFKWITNFSHICSLHSRMFTKSNDMYNHRNCARKNT